VILALLLALSGQTAIDAERAFAAAAQSEGQWTAFRRFAAQTAVLFTPRITSARAYLENRTDPAKAISWSPSASFVSCDGKVAVNTGPATMADGAPGYFTTIWHRQASGEWRFVLDHHAPLAAPRPFDKTLKVRTASCRGRGNWEMDLVDRWRNRSASPDNSITWLWSVNAQGKRRVDVSMWVGQTYEHVIHDVVNGPVE
jgi:hypothetical protein